MSVSISGLIHRHWAYIESYFNCPISHNQYYLIPEDAVNSDYVGNFVVNKVDTIFTPRTGSYSYSIVSGNASNIFAINSSTGLITINDRTSLTFGNISLIIRISVDATSSDYTAFIRVIELSKCHFSNFTTGVAGNAGTRALPKKYLYNWNSIQVAGHAYFLARGTNENDAATTFTATVNGCYYGSYGQGVSAMMSNRAPVLAAWGTTNGNRDIQMYDIDITDDSIEYNVGGLRCEFHRMNFLRATSNGGIYEYAEGGLYYTTSCDSKLSDCTSTDSISHGFKLGKGWVVTNVEVYANANNGICTQGGSTTFNYLYSHNNILQYGIELDQGNNVVDYSVFDTNNNNVVFAWQTKEAGEINSNNIVKRSIIQNGASSQVYSENATTPALNVMSNNLIDNCIIRNGGSSGIYLYGLMNTFEIKNCTINNNSRGMYIGTFGTLTSQSIHHNIVHSNTTSGIEIGGAVTNDVILLDHNTVLDNGTKDLILNSSAFIISLRNTIYQTITNLSNADTQTTNAIDTTGSNFVNRASRNYHLVVSAAVKGAGTDIGYTVDKDNVTLANPPSIGAFEYI